MIVSWNACPMCRCAGDIGWRYHDAVWLAFARLAAIGFEISVGLPSARIVAARYRGLVCTIYPLQFVCMVILCGPHPGRRQSFVAAAHFASLRRRLQSRPPGRKSSNESSGMSSVRELISRSSLAQYQCRSQCPIVHRRIGIPAHRTRFVRNESCHRERSTAARSRRLRIFARHGVNVICTRFLSRIRLFRQAAGEALFREPGSVDRTRGRRNRLAP